MIVIRTILQLLFLKKAATELCRLPSGENGTCIQFKDCEALRKLIPLAREYTYYRTYLKQTQCKIAQVPWVCCPLYQSEHLNTRIELAYRKDLPKPQDGVCGKQYGSNVPNRIVGGEETKIGEFPWNVLLIYDKPFYRTGYHCGGTLITSEHVLTAAHCVSKSVIPVTWNLKRVRLGEKDLSSEADCEDVDDRYTCSRPPYDVDIEKTTIHEQYAALSGSPYDIAIITLAQSVEFTEFVRPICLPINTNDVNIDFGIAVIAGFGKTETTDSSDRLMKAEVSIINLKDCRRKYAIQGRTIHNSHICAAGDNSDSCKGDSGGGLIMQAYNSQIWYLIGITSFGHRNCRSEYPGVYVNVKNYIDWIIEKIQSI